MYAFSNSFFSCKNFLGFLNPFFFALPPLGRPLASDGTPASDCDGEETPRWHQVWKKESPLLKDADWSFLLNKIFVATKHQCLESRFC
ncbi:hypothetical protein ES332_D10G272900v1 [Gossypium tomentosum]|uniref:Uncharacterized protein n=1 Tax=Gossypium tomentosum TaxID=34277 RepID=A0A5D2J8Z6_GOSTO|nr:hypothetical protein ES332_D10G272900v1 [Gossypium tomentosum]